MTPKPNLLSVRARSLIAVVCAVAIGPGNTLAYMQPAQPSQAPATSSHNEARTSPE